MPIVSCSNKEAILKTIVMGLFTNAAYLHPSGMYKTIRGDISLKVHLQIDLFQAFFLYLLPSPCSFLTGLNIQDTHSDFYDVTIQ